MEPNQYPYKAALSAEQMLSSAAAVQIRRQPLRNRLSLLTGAGGNIVILPGSEGTLAVDSGLLSAEGHVKGTLQKLGVEPLRHLVNTHWHFDHTGGNVWMNREGATVIAHENSRTRMSASQTIPAFDVIVPPSPNAALPTVFSQNAKRFWWTTRSSNYVVILRHTRIRISPFSFQEQMSFTPAIRGSRALTHLLTTIAAGAFEVS